MARTGEVMKRLSITSAILTTKHSITTKIKHHKHPNLHYTTTLHQYSIVYESLLHLLSDSHFLVFSAKDLIFFILSTFLALVYVLEYVFRNSDQLMEMHCGSIMAVEEGNDYLQKKEETVSSLSAKGESVSNNTVQIVCNGHKYIETRSGFSKVNYKQTHTQNTRLGFKLRNIYLLH